MSDKKERDEHDDDPTRVVREVTVAGVPTDREFLRYSREAVENDESLAWVPDAADRHDDDAYYVRAQSTEKGHEIPVPKKKDVLRDLEKIARPPTSDQG